MKKTMKLLFGSGLFIMVALLALAVSVVTQDTQRLQKERRALLVRMDANAERIRVLEAEWAYLTRPDYLLAALRKVEPDAGWQPAKGEAMVSMDDFLGLEKDEQVAALAHEPPAIP